MRRQVGNVERSGIVGGGMLGMTLALRLAQHGHEVTLFESAPELGGLASAWQVGEVTWDRHYHVTLLSDAHLRSLLDELGLEKQIEWVETRTGCYTDGVLYSVSNTLEFLRFPPLRAVDKLRLGATIFYASKIRNWRKLERVPVSDWLTRLSGKRTFELFWLPLLRSKLGENYRHASASFIWAIIARLYAARRTGLKKEMFGYVPGGYARVLQRFGEVMTAHGVNVELGAAVAAVDRAESGACVTLRDGSTQRFDNVVVTTAAPVAARLVAGLNAREQQLLEGVRYQGIVCASLLLDKPLASYYVTNITDTWVPFTAVIEMSTLVDSKRYLAGHHLVYLPKYVAEDDPIVRRSDAEIEEQFLAALERMYPHFRRGDVLAFRISRVRYVLPIATLRYSEHVPDMATSLPGVWTVNSSQILNGTLNVNETVQLAERAAERLLARGVRHVTRTTIAR